MTDVNSVLYRDQNNGALSTVQKFALNQKRLNCHSALMNLRDDIADGLPDKLKDQTDLITMQGLISALGRILATTPDQQRALPIIEGIKEATLMEIAFWSDRRELH